MKDNGPISADQEKALHEYLTRAEELARYIRLTSRGQMSLTVVRNKATTQKDRQGIDWDDAHDWAYRLGDDTGGGVLRREQWTPSVVFWGRSNLTG